MSNTLLLIDCNPQNSTGEQLESMLASAGVGDQLRREIVVDPAQISFDQSWLGDRSSNKSSLIFFLLLPAHAESGGALIEAIKKQQPDLPIIVVVDELGPVDTLELLHKGASDLITPPLRVGDTLPRVWRLLEKLDQRASTVQTLLERVGMKLMVGQAPNFLAEIKKIPLIARCDSRVLISGETGTGKEMCARAIHYLSPRKSRPFVPVNCGAIPTELVENELFGHDRGAFTGANSAKAGLIQEAEGGTLFLDEIDCLPAMSQVKLLRFLQEKEYRRLGSSKVRQADVRVLAASNAPLEEALESGRVRQDLYYRLNVLSISLPPLRERRMDIPTLAQHFVAKFAAELDDRVTRISAQALQKLTFNDWPGNVRELEHAIERAVMFCATATIEESDIVLPATHTRQQGESFQEAKAKVIEQFEKEYIQNLLLSHQGNISKAAQAANKNRRAFWELIRKHQMDVRAFKQRA
ncbi:MAG TPA: sigma-54 dependent transcriptional regulator [Pyrinomonadaceae bacterium]|nr:sigma-54 dependent transcriptional regulator [Pyrinomonadaceae bacterium]